MPDRKKTIPNPAPLFDVIGGIVDKLDDTPAETIEGDQDRDRCKHSQELREAAKAVWRERGSRYKRCRLANFFANTPQQVKVKTALKAYAEHAAERIDEGVGIVLIGHPGTGKDHLLSAMMTAAFRAGKLCKWTSGPYLFATLRDDIDGRVSEWERTREYARPDVLVISDPMPIRGELSNFQAAKLYGIIDARYNEQRATWVSVNATNRVEADQRIGRAIVDRLIDGAVSLSCDWPSYRTARQN